MIAEKRFAKGIWRTFQGGRVLLMTVTLPETIICAPGLIEDRYDESDCLVDRAVVTVAERYSQISSTNSTTSN